MNFPDWLPVYGDTAFRGNCPPEHVELASFFSKLRREHPDTFGAIAIHPRNEAQLRNGQFSAVAQHKAEGMTPGAADILIPARVPFICELKRTDHTKSSWQPGQVSYLEAASNAGAFVCAALGAFAAWKAFQDWSTMRTAAMSQGD